MSNPLLPLDPEGREILAERIDAAVVKLQAIDTLKAEIKEIADKVEDTLNIKKAAFNKLAKSKHKEDAMAVRLEAEDVEAALDILYAG